MPSARCALGHILPPAFDGLYGKVAPEQTDNCLSPEYGLPFAGRAGHDIVYNSGVCPPEGHIMDRDGIGFLFVVLVPAALSVLAGVLTRAFRPAARVRAARTHRMRLAAQQMGLRFYAGAEDRVLAALPECSLLEKGASRRAANVMGDGQKPPGVLAFDFEYGRVRATADQEARDALYLVAMVHLAAGGADLPYACIYRTDWLGGPVGVSDVYRFSDLDDPEFITGYMLAGRPAQQVRALLRAPVRAAIKQWSRRGPRPVVETLPGWVAVYVESELDDRRIAIRCSEIVRYAELIAGALRGSQRAPTA